MSLPDQRLFDADVVQLEALLEAQGGTGGEDGGFVVFRADNGEWVATADDAMGQWAYVGTGDRPDAALVDLADAYASDRRAWTR